jgi:hypothetical protein
LLDFRAMSEVLMAANSTFPVLGWQGGGTGDPPDNMDGSLGWLWQTVGATCCWALSDVICDHCIRSAPADAKQINEEEQIEFDLSIKFAHCSEKAKLDVGSLESLELPPATVQVAAGLSKTTSSAAEPDSGRIRQRRRPKATVEVNRDSSPHCIGTVNELVTSPKSSTSRAENPASSPRSRIVNPASMVSPLSLPQTQCHETSRQLSPEQNALVSGCVSLLTVVAAALSLHKQGHSGDAVFALLFRADSAGTLAAVGGCFHFTAYLATLCAFSSASSTVITPLMQMSAVWMLPFSTMAAALGFAAFIRPVHLLSVVFICAGGFLPAADGSLSSIMSSKFWRQKAVRYVIVGELLICCYNVLLHQATFGPNTGAGEQQVVVSAESSNAADQLGTTLRFFLVSRTMNGLSCIFLYLVVPSLRSHALALRDVSARFFLTSLAGECLSCFGVCLVTFSYASFYEPSVVNAVEGGLQQLFNLLFALATKHLFGLGRGVDQVTVKVISFVLVATGLVLSTA